MLNKAATDRKADGDQPDGRAASVLSAQTLPDSFPSVDALEDFMTTPSQALIDDLAAIEGDILILGVGGKMGPTLAGLAKRAAPDKRVIGVARFSESDLQHKLEAWGVETLRCDCSTAPQWRSCRASATSCSWPDGSSASLERSTSPGQ